MSALAQNLRQRVLFSVLIMASGLFLNACAADRSQSQYASQQVQQNLAVLQAVQGTYNGAVTSAIDGASIGSVTIYLQAGVSDTTSSDGTGQSEQAVMNGSISISGLRDTTVKFDKATYDPNTNVFVGNISLANYSVNPPGAATTVTLTGSINGGNFSGHVEWPGYKGLLINAGLNGSNIQSTFSASGARAGELSIQSNLYKGILKTADYTSNLTLKFVSVASDADQDFYDLISPKRGVNVVLTSVETTTGLSNTDSLVGFIQDRLDGTEHLNVSSSMTANGNVSLDCKSIQTPGGAVTLNCVKDSGTLEYQFVLNQAPAGAVTPASPVAHRGGGQ